MRTRFGQLLSTMGVALACLLFAGCDLAVTDTTAPTPTPRYSSVFPIDTQPPTQAVRQSAPGFGGGQQGGDVKVFVEPGASDTPIVNAIAAARQSVSLEVYILTDTPIIDALIAAKQRGLQVRVMLEEHPFGGGSYNQTSSTKLTEGGVEFKWSNPSYKLTHAKYLVVDNSVALILSLNLSKSAVSSNREYGIVTTVPALAQEATGIFEADWQRTSYRPHDPRTVLSPVNSRAQLLALINSAQKTLVVEDEELQDTEIENALVAVQQRGVRVQVVLEDPAKVSTNRTAGDAIRQGGVQVRYQTTPYLHAKMILADSAHVYIGSVNLSTQSMDANREVGLILDDAQIIATAATTFQQDWSNGAN